MKISYMSISIYNREHFGQISLPVQIFHAVNMIWGNLEQELNSKSHRIVRHYLKTRLRADFIIACSDTNTIAKLGTHDPTSGFGVASRVNV